MRSDLVSELLILQKWRDSRSPIKFKLSSDALSVQGWATVERADASEVALNFRDGDGFLTLAPSRCEFRYQEPREAAGTVKAAAESQVVCALSLSAPGGIDLFLFEWKTGEELS